MEIDPRRLRVLLAVARAGGVLAAADLLHVTPSAVSQQLARLEREVGAALLERHPRGVTLTAEGRDLVEVAENIERELGEARRRLSARAGDLEGHVSVGGFQTFLSVVLVPGLPAWRERQPGIAIEIMEGSGDVLARELRAGDLDLAVVEYDADEPGATLPATLREVPLLDDPWRLVVPAHSTAGEGLVAWDRLGAPWLGVDSNAAMASAARRVRRSLGGSGESVHRYGDYETALALVAAGEGVALIPSLALQRELPEGVEIVDVPGLGARRVAVRHRTGRRALPPATDAVLAFVRELAAAAQGGVRPAESDPGSAAH